MNLIFGMFCRGMSDWENPNVHHAKKGPIGSEDQDRTCHIESFTWAFWVTDSESSWPLAVTFKEVTKMENEERSMLYPVPVALASVCQN